MQLGCRAMAHLVSQYIGRRLLVVPSSSHRCFSLSIACSSYSTPNTSPSSLFSSFTSAGASKAKSSPLSLVYHRVRHTRSVSLLAAASGVLALALTFIEPVPSDAETSSASQQNTSGDGDDDLPYYRLSEVKEHGPKSDRPWVTHQGKIYDITDWVPAHPGGEVILRAAGGSIEPYWDIFSIHKSQYVRDILEQYVIGQVHQDDLLDGGHHQIEDPFVSDPERDSRLRFLTQKPCNAESPGDGLAGSFLTPNEVFYVRNHMWVPVVDNADDYEVSIELPDGDIKSYTIRELQSRFEQHAVTAVMQCSGNRRKDMTDNAKKTNGLQWAVGAISCAKWEGVLLRDVLTDAGLPTQPGEDAQHVQFSGMEAYGASIPIASALDPRGDVLLAFRMNDEPLPRDHGFPVRVVVPGHVAARCVKWLKKIVVSDEESNTTWQRRDYKCFGPNETKQDWDKYKSIQKMPVTSAITRTRMKPQSPQVVQVEGYAYSGGGREIQRVDISLDGGETWDQARLLQEDMELERGHKAWCWNRWRYEGKLPGGGDAKLGEGKERRTTFVVKATDDAYNTQPETYKGIYNLRGNLATAWHRVDFSWGEDMDVSGPRTKP